MRKCGIKRWIDIFGEGKTDRQGGSYAQRYTERDRKTNRQAD